MDANSRRAQSRRQILSAFADRRGELDLQSTGFKSQTIMRVGPLGPPTAGYLLNGWSTDVRSTPDSGGEADMARGRRRATSRLTPRRSSCSPH